MSNSSGISFCGLLTIVFVVLKLIGYITWSWLWVLCPLWLGLAVATALGLLFIVVFNIMRKLI